MVFFLNNQKNNFKAKINVSPINKNTISQTPADKLKYYWDLIPNQTDTYSSYFLKKPVTNTYNDDGLNETENYSTEKKATTFRIITLGDSFTFGQYVNTKDNWTEVLERKLNEKQICKNIDKFEIINFGVAGYDYQYEVEKYKIKGQKYNPDLLLWMLVQPDRVNEIEIPFLRECTKNQSSNDDTIEQKRKFSDCLVYVTDSIKQKYKSNGLTIFQSNNIDKISSYYNKKIIFIDFFNYHQNIINNLKYENYSSLNFNQEFDKKNKIQPMLFPDLHPNTLGHQLTAEIIFDQLFKSNQIPCEPN